MSKVQSPDYETSVDLWSDTIGMVWPFPHIPRLFYSTLNPFKDSINCCLWFLSYRTIGPLLRAKAQPRGGFFVHCSTGLIQCYIYLSQIDSPIRGPPDITIAIKELNPVLTCVICGGYLYNAATITECLHSCEYCQTSSYEYCSYM